MNRLWLYKQLYRHRSLAVKRAVDASQNKVARYILYAGYAFMLLYLAGMAIALSLAVNDSPYLNPIAVLVSGMPFILLIDFLLRFFAQQTPAQIIKPYMLLPMPRRACIECFVGISLFNWGNLTWFVLFIPYCIMSVITSYGLFSTLLLLLFLTVLILINSQWYIIIRTLLTSSLAYWLLPLAIYALMACPLYVGVDRGIVHFFHIYSQPGILLSEDHVWPIIIALLVLAVLITINLQLQNKAVWCELTHIDKDISITNNNHLSFLSRFGVVGEYLKLELKMLHRNRNVRTTFIYATAIIVFFSLIITFSAIYDEDSKALFWCLYNFNFYGIIWLSNLMCVEGNYIDGLMVHKENIYQLFKAKYIFYSLLLLWPFLLMLPPVLMGKWSLLMLVCFILFTAGFQHFLLFQLAVYNKRTLSLNTRLTGRRASEQNYIQLLIKIVSLAIPYLLASVVVRLFSETTAFLLLGGIGLIFVLSAPWWLQNIYRRFMRRRYDNMEGFRTTR